MWGAPLMCGFHQDTVSGQLVGFLVRYVGLALCMSSVYASTSAETTLGYCGDWFSSLPRGLMDVPWYQLRTR